MQEKNNVKNLTVQNLNFISESNGRPLEGSKQGIGGIRFTVTEVVLGV